jgi:hypothetical protein
LKHWRARSTKSTRQLNKPPRKSQSSKQASKQATMSSSMLSQHHVFGGGKRVANKMMMMRMRSSSQSATRKLSTAAAAATSASQEQQQQQPQPTSSALGKSITQVFGVDVGGRFNSLLCKHLQQQQPAPAAAAVATMDNVELLDLRSHGMGVGLMAARDLKRGETVVAIPPSLWQPLSVEAARQAMPIRFTQSVDAVLSTDDNKRGSSSSSNSSGSGDIADMSAVFEAMMTKQVLYHSLHLANQMHANNADSSSGTTTTTRSAGKGGGDLGAYLDVLSQTPLDVPMFWSEARLAKLDGTPVPNTVRERRQFISRLYESFVRPMHEASVSAATASATDGAGAAATDPTLSLFQGASASNFAWAYSLALSRALSGGGGVHFALVPVVDWINHSREPLLPTSPRVPDGLVTISHDRATDCFVVRAVDDVKQGTQLVAEYGQLGNAELLRQYGFAISNNVFDRALVEVSEDDLELSKEAKGKEEEAYSGGGGGGEEEGVKHRRGFFVSHMEPLPRTLVSFVRQAVEKEMGGGAAKVPEMNDDVETLQGEVGGDDATDSQMRVQVEVEVARRLLSAVERAFGRYGDASEWLDGGHHDSNDGSTVFVKRTVEGEVQVLNKVQGLLREFIEAAELGKASSASEATDLALFARRRA